MEVVNLKGRMKVRLGESHLGIKSVHLEVRRFGVFSFFSFFFFFLKRFLQFGELWWIDEQEQERLMHPLSIVQSAQSVQGHSGRILILFQGDVLVALHPDSEGYLVWWDAISAWVPTSVATRRLLQTLAEVGRGRVVVRSGDGGGRDSKVGTGESAYREIASWLPKLHEAEKQVDLLDLELCQTKADLVNTTLLLREADAERKDLQKKLENVNQAVRLKAIGLLLNSNRDLANLKLQVDCYQEQVQYFANENEKLKKRFESELAKKDVMLEGFSKALQIVREDRQRLRRVRNCCFFLFPSCNSLEYRR